MKINWAKFVTVAEIFAPQILALTPLAPIKEEVASGIVEAAGMFDSTPEQKLAHVRSIALNAAQAVNDQAGHQVVNMSTVTAVADGAISETYQAVKLIHEAQHLTGVTGTQQAPLPDSSR